jgi:hypothetical protein
MNHPRLADTRCWQSTEAANLPRRLAATLTSAVDGCLVLLCFAAPNWKSVPQCVPPIRKVLRDL